ncbi:MAG: PHP domain-containing protein [archaeon]|jgi:hypothetical protein
MNCDLHTHTYYSDGFHSPEYLIKIASSKKLKALAITDHNGVDALADASKFAKKEKIELITGVEINCESTEILGYFFDPNYEPLLKILEENSKSISDVVTQKIYWLQDNGYNVEMESIFKFAGPTQKVMATHLALELRKNGYVQNLQEAFVGIIKKISIDYKPKRYSAKKVIAEIKNAGGVAVLPHPWYLPLSLRNDFEYYSSKLISYGLSGIETTGPHGSEYDAFIVESKEIAKKLCLIESGGSDFHGSTFFPENELGKYNVDYSVIERLRKKIEK